MALVSLRTLRRIAIVLLCLWILGLLAAVSDLLETSVIDAYSYGFSSDSGPSPFHRQRIKEQVRNRQKTYLRMHKSFLSQQRNHSNNNVSSLLLGDGNHHHRANLPSMNRSHSGHHHHESHPRRSSNNNRLRDAFVPDLSAPPLKLPKPIIVVGFPKAGTSSIFSFFRDQPEQNLKCQHWYCCLNQKSAQHGGPALMSGCMLKNLNKNSSIFEGCGGFDLYAEINGPRPTLRKKFGKSPGLLLDDGSLDYASFDRSQKSGTRIFFPQYFNLDDIHQHYPNATFILNTRPFDSWIKSVQSWADNLDWQFVNEFYQRGELDALPEDRNNATEMASFMRDIYDRHHDRVRQFAQVHPTHALVEVPILDPDAGAILGDAFGLDGTRWGRVNANRGPPGTIRVTVDFLQDLVPDFDENPYESFLFFFVAGTVCSMTMILAVLGARHIYKKYYLQIYRKYLQMTRR